MHARIDQLLSVRDGEPVDATVRTHVESCRDCAAAVQQMREVRQNLAALPQVEPNPGAWRFVGARIAAREQSARRRTIALRVVAAASVASLALFATLYGSGSGPASAPDTVAAQQPARDTTVASLVDRSLDLERALAALPSRPAIERAETSIPIDALQARVQWIDQQLSLADAAGTTAEDAEQLWRARVEVMRSLVSLRYVEAQRVAL
ncbi:MAG: hypothetical protein MUO39_07700 [Steroidobacteraceae bacterium]|nr:hypothetical protein [Steroidobacteraceae bacterium]